MAENPVLVEVHRGAKIESRHRGAVIVMEASGAIAFAAGDVDAPVFPRSAIKAIQALPLIESGAADTYNLTQSEIALACASHSGEARHAALASNFLAKFKLDERALECGVQWPMSEKAARLLAKEQRQPSALHNNCSGKHAGFLCVCCSAGINPAGYVKPGHFLQDELRGCLEDLTGAAHGEDNRGTDGCSIPTYAVPLRHLALAFARFTSGSNLAPIRAKAARRILAAIAAAPEMVAGEGRFDTKLIQIFGARAMVKTGAEGVYCGCLPELGLGIALKCDDGGTRAAEVMMAATLEFFLKKSEVEAENFAPLLNPILKNWNGLEVGKIRASAAFAKQV